MRRVVIAAAALSAVLITSACSAPPQKEIDRAQGAIDAARAAGAEQYAREPFAAATSAMQQTHEAVAQRDYRLALSRAIDANERALEAAGEAANGKARARSEAEVALHTATTALRGLDERLRAADVAKVTARDTAAARRARTETDRRLQELRAAVAGGGYLEITVGANEALARIRQETQGLEEAIDAKSARAPRRRR